ncbi:hypothetical protein E6O75_ATG07484 [Venturia nashicola]|uniref:Uncharacterized protein n=1 Tax=Venturia nashicola TaxID=86259 RepID=A0A4Z1PBX0_9PEZI|nr:hypothetical protein E6O75_ATG07484 [Venturia nashicola]
MVTHSKITTCCVHDCLAAELVCIGGDIAGEAGDEEGDFVPSISPAYVHLYRVSGNRRLQVQYSFGSSTSAGFENSMDFLIRSPLIVADLARRNNSPLSSCIMVRMKARNAVISVISIFWLTMLMVAPDGVILVSSTASGAKLPAGPMARQAWRGCGHRLDQRR